MLQKSICCLPANAIAKQWDNHKTDDKLFKSIITAQSKKLDKDNPKPRSPFSRDQLQTLKVHNPMMCLYGILLDEPGKSPYVIG